MEDNESDSYDQTKIQQLRKQIQTPKTQLLQLAYSDELLNNKIEELNNQGCSCVVQQLFYEAMAYLQEAEKILEYSAGCGSTIDRSLIVATLHNQATVYQRIWELVRSADYIEAIIYNVSSFLNTEDVKVPKHKNQGSTKFSIFLGNKLSLITYLLQFCAVSSQIKNHSVALSSALKALNLLKTFCSELYDYQKVMDCGRAVDFQRGLLGELKEIGNFQGQEGPVLDETVQKLISKASKSIRIFQKKLQWPPTGISKPQIKQLEMFSLGQLMQVSPKPLNKVQQKLDLQMQLTLVKKVYKAIYISISHFTIATQLRLIANQKYGVDSSIKKQSKEFKQSQIHHLVALITVTLYVPCFTKYFQHILKSFKNHYQIDLAQLSQSSEDGDEELKVLQMQSISQRESNLSRKQRGKEIVKRQSHNFMKKNQRADPLNTRQKPHNKTIQDFNINGSLTSSTEHSNLKTLNRTNLDGLNEALKNKIAKKSKSKKKTEQTSRQKGIIIMQKVIKSHSKNKGDKSHRRSKSGRKMHEEEQQKVVHYFQYDNYKKVVKKGVKNQKQGKPPSDLLKRAKGVREKRSPEVMLTTQLKKMNQVTQSSKNLNNINSKSLRKHKSPDLNLSRSPHVPRKHK